MSRRGAWRALGVQLLTSQAVIAALFAWGGEWRDGFVAPFAGLVFAGLAALALLAATGRVPRLVGHAALFVFNFGGAFLWYPSID